MQTITRYRIYLPVTYSCLEVWLKKMSLNGAHLIRYNAIKYTFELGNPMERTYFAYQCGGSPHRGEGFFNISLRYPLLFQEIGMPKKRSHLNNGLKNAYATKMIIEVDAKRLYQKYMDLVAERNRLYLLKFLRDGSAVVLLVLLFIMAFLLA